MPNPPLQQRVAPLYRRLRRLKNRAMNLIDQPVIVLGYHRVAALESDPHRIAVTPENFRAQMRYLRDNYLLLRLDDDWRGLRKPAVVITFDDGYADNLHEALPILEEAGVPATFFITSGMLGSPEEFWFDELERLLLSRQEPAPDFVLRDADHGGSFPAADTAQRRALHDLLHRLLLGVSAGRRAEWLEQLRRWAGAGSAGREGYLALTADGVRSLAASPLVTIGAHSVTHTPLALLAEEEQRREIVQSKRELEELTGKEVRLFAYPFGGYGQYDRTTRRLCREAGIERAVTTFPGQAHRWSDPFQLPRQLVRDWEAAEFAAMMEGFLA